MEIVDHYSLGLDPCVFGQIHKFVVSESDGGQAHKLMCQICLQIINYKDVKKLQRQKTVTAEILQEDI